MHQKQLSGIDLDKIKKLIMQKSWWETVDSLDAVVGTIVAKHPELKQCMLEWSVSDNIWLRRVAINFQQKYKENTDIDLLVKIIQNNFKRDEFFVNKAIGWSLRGYSKINADWVRNYLEKCKGKLVPLSVKEASKYL